MINLDRELARLDTQLDNVNIILSLHEACKDMPFERRNYIIGALNGPSNVSLIDRGIALIKHLIEMAKEFAKEIKDGLLSLKAKAKSLADKIKNVKGNPDQDSADYAGGGDSNSLDDILKAEKDESSKASLKMQASKIEDSLSGFDPENPDSWEEKSKDIEDGVRVDVKSLGKSIKKMKDGSIVYRKEISKTTAKLTTVRNGKVTAVTSEKIGLTVKMPNSEELNSVADELEVVVGQFSKAADGEMDKNIERVNKRINDYLTKLQKRVRKGGLTESQQTSANKIVNELTQALKYVNREGRVLDKASYAHAKMILDMVDKARSNLK